MTLEETREEDPQPESTSELALPEPETLLDGRYRIGKKLGSGGMGAVFEAVHLAVKRRYAIKFLRVEVAGKSRSLSRFGREAELLGSLVHDNLTAVIDFGFYRQTSPYLVMEYVEGTTLRARLEAERFSPQHITEVMIQVCNGIAHAHKHGIIHRDLKPENLMLSQSSEGQERVKILDFGIARQIVDEEGVSLTPTGADLGTPHYMSPEQARGEKQISARADVYAMGVILYEAVTGKKPHPGDTYNQVIFHLLTETPAPIRQLAPECPASLREVIERCIHRTAARRYADGHELREALTDALAAFAPQAAVSSKRVARTSRFWQGAAFGGAVVGAVLLFTRGSAEESVALNAETTDTFAHPVVEARASSATGPALATTSATEVLREPVATVTEPLAAKLAESVSKKNERSPTLSATKASPGKQREPVIAGTRDGTSPATRPASGPAAAKPAASGNFKFVTDNPYE